MKRLVAAYSTGGEVTHVPEDGELAGGKVLPGLRLVVGDLFD